MTKKKYYKCSLLIIIIILIQSCYTPIIFLEKNPKFYHGKKVRIKGYVISSVRLKDISVFTVKGQKKHIMVKTDYYLPLYNDFVKVKGIFDTSFVYKNNKIYIINEKVKYKIIKPKEKNKFKYFKKKNLKPI